MNSLHYLDPNPGGFPSVLLLHGLGANGTSWTLQFDPLTQAGFRPLAPDVPGFGKSPYDGHGWNISRVAKNMVDLLVSLSASPIHLIGISMGGTIAQQIAMDHPEMVDKLVLVNTFSYLRPKKPSGWLYFLQRFLLVHILGLPTQAKFVAKRIFPGEDQQAVREMLIEQITEADPRAYRAAMRSLGMFNSSKRLTVIKAKTLVITGQCDTTVPLENQKYLVDHIPDARQVIIPEAGHAVTIDKPAEFNLAMMNYLAP